MVGDRALRVVVSCMTMKNPEWEWPMRDSVIVVEGLVKRFGAVEALAGIDLSRCDVARFWLCSGTTAPARRASSIS